jgi:HAD superfamily hydrolase (TIGR01549 family)
MLIQRRVRCLLFDLGSTLWERAEEGDRQAREEACQRAGELLLASGGALFAAQEALALGHQVRSILWHSLREEKQLRPAYEPDFAQAATRALQHLGLLEADLELGAALFEALRVRIPVSRVLFPDTLRTLQALKQRGYILGVVTNRDYGGQPFRDDLQTMGLLDYFEYHHMAISADLGIRKPNPAIFQYALERLGVSPGETAMVGDNLHADIGGARNLHMLGIWKARTSYRAQEEGQLSDATRPDLTIEHLQDLLQFF